MRFNFSRKVAVAMALSALAIGGFASSASAVTPASEEPPPPAVLEQIQRDAGQSDGAALEALKASPYLAPYCTTYVSYNGFPGAPVGVIFKIPSTSAGYFDCYLESGNVSVAVSALQETLNVCYGQGLVVDGNFGPATYNALMYAQSVEGIGVDGVYGPTTRSNIEWASGTYCVTGSSIGL